MFDVNKPGEFSHSRNFFSVILIYLHLILLLSSAPAQACRATSHDEILFFPYDDTISLGSSYRNQVVTVNKLETFIIMLPLDFLPDYLWMLETDSLNAEVLAEVGISEVSINNMGITDSNEAGSEYIRWTFVAKESGFCNLKFNYKNPSDNDIYSICEVAVTVLPDPGERPAAFSLVVQPGKIDDAIVGQKCVFLVKVIDEGDGFGKAEPVNISATSLDWAYDTVVIVEPNVIVPGEICEITVIPGGLVDDNSEDPNTLRGVTVEDDVRPDDPNDNDTGEPLENRESVVNVTAERYGVMREQLVRIDLYPGEDVLGELAQTYRDRFIPWLEVNYPELGITSETIWEGTIVKPRILVVMYYLFYSEQWEMGVRWHVMIPPYDFAEIYLRKRGSDLACTYAFKIFSLDSGEDPQVVDLPTDSIWR